mmetsp:Transcript_14337/g.38875  ORF Transcript_14337/g.38875 Transcript_14337/m.38875 type:complete len:89 (-) Transcript_14337:1657-1923(-)
MQVTSPNNKALRPFDLPLFAVPSVGLSLFAMLELTCQIAHSTHTSSTRGHADAGSPPTQLGMSEFLGSKQGHFSESKPFPCLIAFVPS